MAQEELTLKCVQCQGEMYKSRESASTVLPLFLILIGVVFFFLFWPLGLVFVLIGLIKGGKMKFFWVCDKCGYNFERKPTWKDYLK